MVHMPSPTAHGPRRTDALSRKRIVTAAIELLDRDGSGALTVRTLTAHLATGRGAIYHHVASMDELLAEAADHVVVEVTGPATAAPDADTAIRALALGLFDAIDAHPWVGAQLSREPLQPAVLRIWKGLGAQLRRLSVNGPARSDAGAALVNYILGSAAQYAAGARRLPDEVRRQEYLEALASEWTAQDTDPLVNEAATQIRAHDDREQFLAGVDIFLTGIKGLR